MFNVLGEVSKIRFVTIDCNDPHCYSELIERSEQNSESMTDRLKEQLCVVKLCYGLLTALFVMWTVMELKWKMDCYRLNTVHKSCFFGISRRCKYFTIKGKHRGSRCTSY